MEQINALNALEPFIALTKTTTSPRAAVDLVTRATSAPNTFVFAELLQTPTIQSLAKSEEHAPYLRLLHIFSHGTYADYVNTPNLPPLTYTQEVKLRQLSLLTLARTTKRLTYASLQSALNLPKPRDLEELVISAVYANLLNAQLDPKHELVEINSVAPLRDVAPEPAAIESLLASLQAWSGRCDATLTSLESQMAAVRAEADRRAAAAAAQAQETAKIAATTAADGNGDNDKKGQDHPPAPGSGLVQLLRG